MSRRPVVLASSLLAFSQTWSGRADALEITSEVTPSAAGCPDTGALRSMVAERLGRDPVGAGTVTAWFSPGRAELRVVVGSDPPIDRVLTSSHSRDCRVLANTVATTIALLVDDLPPERAAPPPPVGPGNGDRVDDAERPRPGADAASARPMVFTPPIAPATDDLEAPPPAPKADLSHGFVGAESHLSAGAAPAASFGVGAWAGYQRRALSARLFGRVDLPASGEGAEALRVRTQLFSAGFAPCLHKSWFEACPIAAVAFLRAEGGANIRGARRDELVFGMFGARLAAHWRISPSWGLVTFGEAFVPAPRPVVRAGAVEAWAMPLVVASLGVGIQLGQ